MNVANVFIAEKSKLRMLVQRGWKNRGCTCCYSGFVTEARLPYFISCAGLPALTSAVAVVVTAVLLF